MSGEYKEPNTIIEELSTKNAKVKIYHDIDTNCLNIETHDGDNPFDIFKETKKLDRICHILFIIALFLLICILGKIIIIYGVK